MGIKQKFQGYNTKPDKLLGNGAIASDCSNVIFNKGDLCNIPMSDRKYSYDTTDERLVGLYYYKVKNGAEVQEITAIITLDALGKLKIANYKFDSSRPTEIQHVYTINDFGSGGQVFKIRYPYDYSDPRQTQAFDINSLSGNMVQVNDWMMFLCQTGDEVPTTVNNDIPKVYPQMLMLRFPAYKQQIATEWNYLFSLVGQYQPSRVEIGTLTVNGGTVNGTGLDFGFSFVTEHHDNELSNDTALDPIESNVTIYNNPINYSDAAVTFKVYLPSGHNSLWPYGLKYVYIYTKEQDQSIYYYSGRYQINNSNIATDTNGVYVLLSIGGVGQVQLEDQTLTRPAPLTSVFPIAGAHDPPKLATHGCYYKGKMYYNCLEFKNLLQISARTPVGKIDTGLYANYIEVWEFVGKESSNINGLIEYQGQLVIFQDIETYVLTNDLNQGGVLQILFHELGCSRGGKAYCIFEETLVFGNRKGIFIFNGSSEPKRISDDIQKDLEKISRIRYEYMRLSVDEEHKLLFVNFPWGKGCTRTEIVPTFVFHYADGGKWTKIDAVSDVLSDKFCNQDTTKQFNIFYKDRKHLRLIKSVDDSSLLFGEDTWTWTSSFFDGGTQERIKHWKWLQLELVPELDSDFQITIEFFDERGLSMNEGGTNIADLTEQKFRRISARTKLLSFKMTGIAKKAFRINSFELEAHVTSRR